MNTKGAIGYANEDTPARVKVTDSYGLMIWAFGRFGVAVVFAYAAYMLYQDGRSDQAITRQLAEKILEARIEDRKLVGDMVAAFKQLNTSKEEDRQALNRMTAAFEKMDATMQKLIIK